MGGKKTILPKDILEAVKELEFEEFVPRLENELKSLWPAQFPRN